MLICFYLEGESLCLLVEIVDRNFIFNLFLIGYKWEGVQSNDNEPRKK